jgi:aryl-alcohol dehydrogenase-like predicted oxidoreductase
MRTVKLGRTGRAVTPLAYGTWQFGGDWGPVDDQAAIAAVQHARSLGINFFDTAQAYGFGRAERLLGTALAADLRSARESVVIATKGGLRMDGDRLVRDASGAVTEATTFADGDWRAHSPAFTGAGFTRNLKVVAALRAFAAGRGATIAQLAVAWVLARPAVQVAIVGARTPAHLTESLGALDLTLSQDDLAEIDCIMAAAVPVGGPTPEGMS